MEKILKILKKVINKILGKIGLKIIRTEDLINNRTTFSYLGEEEKINKYLQTIPLDNKYCVDIAAADGFSMSNTLFLYKNNWDGIAVEYNSEKFATLSELYKKFENINLIKTKVTPDNVLYILQSCLAPKNFSFLNLDIDSYDYYVLDKLLSEYRPMLICAEINENIPPPIKFTVKYDLNHFWEEDHFHGQSLSQLFELCKKYQYDIVELLYNNAFLIPNEINKNESLKPEKAYDAGYKNKNDRKLKFPWDKDMEELLYMTALDGIEFINKKFVKYKNRYICEL
jgi:hypothetical protein